MRLPPQVSEKDFSEALGQFAQAVGKEWVFSEGEELNTYRDPYSIYGGEPEEMIPSAAVAPDRVEQVQQIVTTANTYKIPLWPISTGKNLGYGAAAPRLSGSVVLDLKRMNRILEVNERHAYALVEPGVSYFDLYRYIQEKGMKLWIDCPSPGWGSVIGNALDHGVGFTPYPHHDHFQAQCGMEVVLANGEVMRTGMGALPGAETWQQFKYGFGPYLDGMFSQSNFGIVTKMGIWLFPEPEAFRFCSVSAPREQDVIRLVDIQRRLRNSGILRGHPSLAPSLSQLAGDAELKALFAKPEGPSTGKVEQLLHKKGLGYWLSGMSFYGPPKLIDDEWAYVQQQFSVISGATFRTGKLIQLPLNPQELDSAALREARKVRLGIPNLEIFDAGTGAHSVGHFFFSPIIPYTGEALLELSRMISDVCKEMGVPPFFRGAATPSPFYPRCLIILLTIPVRQNDVEFNKQNRELFKRLVQEATKHGWGEYRAPTAFMDMIAETYSYNNHVLRRFQETIKDAVDPNGILAAGKSGIWPKHLRD